MTKKRVYEEEREHGCQEAFERIQALQLQWKKSKSHRERSELAWRALNCLAVLNDQAFSWCLNTAYEDLIAHQEGLKPKDISGAVHHHRVLDAVNRPLVFIKDVEPSSERAALLEILDVTSSSVPALSAAHLSHAFETAKFGVMDGIFRDMQKASIQRPRQIETVIERRHQLNVILAIRFLVGHGATIHAAREFWADYFDDCDHIHPEAFRDWERRELPNYYGKKLLEAHLDTVKNAVRTELERESGHSNYLSRMTKSLSDDERKKYMADREFNTVRGHVAGFVPRMEAFRRFLGLSAWPENGNAFLDRIDLATSFTELFNPIRPGN